MSPTEHRTSDNYLTTPVDPTSAESLAASGLELATVDTSDTAAFSRWFQAEARGFHDTTLPDKSVEEKLPGLAHRRTTGVWDSTAADAASPVATVSSWPVELTVPGEKSVEAWAISAVTVSPTHRRRGIARALLESELRTADSLGVPLAILTVSEATIYSRYGFAPTSRTADLKIDTARARWTGPIAAGRVHFVPSESLIDDGLALVERVRLTTPGQIQFDQNLWLRLIGQLGEPTDETRKLRTIRYDDENGVAQGFAVFTVVETGSSFSAHTLDVKYLVSATDDAYAGLWRFLLEMDLVSEVTAHLRAADEPLPWQVEDNRAVAFGRAHDHLWARILDVPAALTARSFSAAGDIVLEISDPLGFAAGSFLLSVDAAGEATVTELDDAVATDAAVVALSVNELGALYLGATSAATLVRAGRIVEKTPGAASVVDAAFRSERSAWLSIWF